MNCGSPVLPPRRRLGAVSLLYAWRAGAGLLVSLALTDALRAAGAGTSPDGDAAIFREGGVLLAEAVRLAIPSLTQAARTSLLLFCLASVAGLVPLTALMVALCHHGPLRAASWASLTVPPTGRALLLGGATLLAQSILLFAVAVLLNALEPTLSSRLNERSASWARGTLVALGVVCAATLGVAQDVAHASIVRDRLGVVAGLRAGARTLLRRPLAVFVGWLSPAVWGLAVVLCAAWSTELLAVDRPGDWRWVTVLALHQATLWGLAFLRATWLSRALTLVEPGARSA